MAAHGLLAAIVKLHAACVIVAMTTLAALGIACFAMPSDPKFTIFGMICVVGTGFTAVVYYLAAFRKSRLAANLASVLALGVSVLAVLAILSTAGESLHESKTLQSWLELRALFAVMASAAVGGAITGCLYITWTRTLPKRAVEEATLIRFRLTELLAAVALVGLFSLQTAYFLRETHPQFAERVTAEAAPFKLPSNAQDVSYAFGYRGTRACEFTTTAESFLLWAKSHDIAVTPVQRPFTMRRYFTYRPTGSGPPEVTIARGYAYRWRKEDRGTYYAFDADTNRAYFHYHGH